MTSIEFFRLKGPAIASRCIVSLNTERIILHSLWTPNRAVYAFKDRDEMLAIARELIQAGAVIRDLQTELADNSD